MAVGAFMFVTIDSVDPERLVRFWVEVLGTDVGEVMDDGRYILLAGSDTLPVICFQRVPESKAGKNRLHLDLSVQDLDAASARIAELGGSQAGEDQHLEQFTWRTMADPEGNEFDIAAG
jgi:predicted enzyme related to lactoylglutathione lyase